MAGIFYGWYMVAAGSFLNFLNSSIFIYGFTAFVNPITQTFGWSYAQISLATSLRGIETGILNPLVGTAVDRFSARKLILIGVVIYATGLFILSRTTNLATLYLSFLIIGLGTSLAIMMVPQTAIARWFKRNIGKANGILFVGIGMGGALIPLWVKLIDRFGWQTTLFYLAIVTLVIGIPLSFVYRSRPENYGLMPDGKQLSDATKLTNISSDYSAGVKEALRTRAFWQITVASMLYASAMMPVVMYIMPYFEALGIEKTTAGMVTMAVPLVSIVARIPSGWISDIFRRKYVLATAMGLLGISLLFFHLVGVYSFSFVFPFFIFFGLGSGSAMPLWPTIYREYFGSNNYGKIFGLGQLFYMIPSVGSPLLVGWFIDTHGGYENLWLVLSGATIIGALVMLTSPLASKQP